MKILWSFTRVSAFSFSWIRTGIFTKYMSDKNGYSPRRSSCNLECFSTLLLSGFFAITGWVNYCCHFSFLFRNHLEWNESPSRLRYNHLNLLLRRQCPCQHNTIFLLWVLLVTCYPASLHEAHFHLPRHSTCITTFFATYRHQCRLEFAVLPCIIDYYTVKHISYPTDVKYTLLLWPFN
jgi:hypothetical protein